MEIIDRKTAKAKGLTRYFTGKPCKHEHIALHDVYGGCVECRRERKRKPSPICQRCGVIFERKNCGPAKWCDTCRPIVYKARASASARRRYARELRYGFLERECAWCGKWFKPLRSGKQKWCPDCRPKVMARGNRDRSSQPVHRRRNDEKKLLAALALDFCRRAFQDNKVFVEEARELLGEPPPKPNLPLTRSRKLHKEAKKRYCERHPERIIKYSQKRSQTEAHREIRRRASRRMRERYRLALEACERLGIMDALKQEATNMKKEKS